MKTNDDPGIFNKLEFWALTAAFVICVALFLDGDIGETIRYVTVFTSVLYIDFRVMPSILARHRLVLNSLALASTFLLIVAVYYATFNIIPGDFDMVETLLILVSIIGHMALKQFALFIISRTELLRSFFVIVNRDGLIATGLWMIITYWIWIVRVPTEVRLAWTCVIPMGILLHSLAFHWFIPSSLRTRYTLITYFLEVGIFCIVAGFAISILVMIATGDEDRSFTIGGFSGVINMIFTAPALWLIYRWQARENEQINALQAQLGQSTASLDSLRSQINPHFLFNVLNTIYGLAIQEKAERTSAAVEKLGDMMRFMLLENMQEWISLKRELEYLDNYISLQRLRTDGNSGLTISVQIPENVDPTIRISPMLLIPFVENSFKHGISRREQSYIKISLELRDSALFFDVSNSTHLKLENDPEKNSNGIGLANVRLRLQHMYPEKHELLVRQTNSDFFVHLRLELE